MYQGNDVIQPRVTAHARVQSFCGSYGFETPEEDLSNEIFAALSRSALHYNFRKQTVSQEQYLRAEMEVRLPHLEDETRELVSKMIEVNFLDMY